MTKWLERAQSVFQKTDETPTLEGLQEAISPGIRVISSGLAPLQKSEARGMQTTAKRLTEIKSAPVIPVSPELEALVCKAAEHYKCPPDEVQLMLEAARNDPEGALTYHQRLAAELDLVPDPAMVQTLSAKVHCAGCRNIRMEEVVIPGVGRRYTWGCAKGHLEHGHSTPELRNLLAPDSCRKALDFDPVAIMNTTERNALQ